MMHYRAYLRLTLTLYYVLASLVQESLLLGHRLETLEKTLRMHHSELMDLMEMKAEIEVTLDHTLVSEFVKYRTIHFRLTHSHLHTHTYTRTYTHHTHHTHKQTHTHTHTS